jgi:shikimate 5-dehydrogenase
MKTYTAAEKPALCFIGVTTSASSIMRVFPAWAKHLRLGGATIRGIDLRIHDRVDSYREAIKFLKHDSKSVGAVITTHKIDLFRACRDLFDELDLYARLTEEISCISKRDGQLRGHAKDPVSAGLSLEAFLPDSYWQNTRAEALILGAGGSSIATTAYLLAPRHGANRASRILVTDRNAARLKKIEKIHHQIAQPAPLEYHLVCKQADNDTLVNMLKPGSLVINATGLGKDRPGSPISDNAKFPEYGYAWEFNYRGDLVFLDQARTQQQNCHLHVEDGWLYFIHGWTRAIAEIFGIEIPTKGPEFDRIADIASKLR